MTKSLVAIVGPTAVGKTTVSIRLARALDGEIVNADSRQIYRYMDIGTAKPSRSDRATVPHHLFDIIDPDEDFSLAHYKDLASGIIDDIHRRGRMPILVGGSGQYVWAILEGWHIPRVAPNHRMRRDLERSAEREGADILYRKLEQLDPEGASRINPRNVRRVIRALEVCLSSGRKFSELSMKLPPDFDALIVGLTAERATLYRRIDDRVDQMVEDGIVAEVRVLMEKGYLPDLPSMSSLGYREIGRYVMGQTTLSDAIERTKYETHRFARQQYTWFQPADERIQWFETAQDPTESILELATDFIATTDSRGNGAG